MSEPQCAACGQTGQALFLRNGKALCYPCLDEITTGIPYVRELEAEVARLTKALEDQALATEKGRELVGPWIVERDKLRERNKALEENREWLFDKLCRWEPLLREEDKATCRDLQHAASKDTNPKLKGASHE